MTDLQGFAATVFASLKALAWIVIVLMAASIVFATWMAITNWQFIAV